MPDGAATSWQRGRDPADRQLPRERARAGPRKPRLSRCCAGSSTRASATTTRSTIRTISSRSTVLGTVPTGTSTTPGGRRRHAFRIVTNSQLVTVSAARNAPRRTNAVSASWAASSASRLESQLRAANRCAVGATDRGSPSIASGSAAAPGQAGPRRQNCRRWVGSIPAALFARTQSCSSSRP